MAGILGAALGPSAGGVITELLGWRVIFVAQAPVAALFLTVALGRPVSADTTPISTTEPRTRPTWAAGAALVLSSGALVALLFLAVLELIDVRGYSPLAAGGAASTIALAALAATPFAERTAATRTGTLLLSGGLVGMALLPGPGLGWPVAAFAVAGFGYGLVQCHGFSW
jgi:MFS family permease